MTQDALGQLKHLKTARARWPFPDVLACGSEKIFPQTQTHGFSAAAAIHNLVQTVT